MGLHLLLRLPLRAFLSAHHDHRKPRCKSRHWCLVFRYSVAGGSNPKETGGALFIYLYIYLIIKLVYEYNAKEKNKIKKYTCTTVSNIQS